MTAANQVKEALIRFQAGIKASDGAAISAALAELDRLLAAHRSDLDPRLAHFLEGRSYAKAAAWLGADVAGGLGKAESPPGGCGGRT